MHMTKPHADKFTPERAKAIATAIKLGATYELAAAYAGVSADSLARWRKKYKEFAEDLRLAEGAGVMVALMKIEKAASRDWRAAAWKLERRYPDSYGRSVVDNRHSTPDGGPILIAPVDYRAGLDALKPIDEAPTPD